MLIWGESCGKIKSLAHGGANARPAVTGPYPRQSYPACSRIAGQSRNLTTTIKATNNQKPLPSMTLIGFNLVKELTFYGAYHNNPVNQLIHFIFVPLILWTVAVWLAYTPPLVDFDMIGALSFLPPGMASVLSKCIVFNGSFVLLAFYALYYVVLEPVAGVTWTFAIALPLWATSEAFVGSAPFAWAYSLALHVFSWFMQVYFGHSVAEKRKPALMDSLFQSLLLAPLFVWFELLFLLGYRSGLRTQVQNRIDQDIAAWKATSAALLEKSDSPLRQGE